MLRVYFQIFKKLYHFTNIYSILQSIYIYTKFGVYRVLEKSSSYIYIGLVYQSGE